MAMESFRHNQLVFEPEDLSMVGQCFNLKTGLMSKPMMVHIQNTCGGSQQEKEIRQKMPYRNKVRPANANGRKQNYAVATDSHTLTTSISVPHFSSSVFSIFISSYLANPSTNCWQ